MSDDEKSLEERKLEIAELHAKALLATSKADKNTRAEQMQNGLQARLRGEPIESCPWQGGLTAFWWKQGYNSVDEGKEPDMPQT